MIEVIRMFKKCPDSEDGESSEIVYRVIIDESEDESHPENPPRRTILHATWRSCEQLEREGEGRRAEKRGRDDSSDESNGASRRRIEESGEEEASSYQAFEEPQSDDEFQGQEDTNESFDLRGADTSHQRAFKPQEKRERKTNFECSYCDDQLAGKIPLAKHLLAHHLSDTGLDCNSCETIFETRNDLLQHILMNHATNPDQLACKVCGKKSTTKGGLKIHYILCHLKRKYFACEHCPKVFSMLHQLKCHYASIHKQAVSKKHQEYCKNNATEFNLSMEAIEQKTFEELGL